MTFQKKTGQILIGVSLIALSVAAAYAQTVATSTTTTNTATTNSTQLVTKYSTFAGSQTNAESLVKGLNSGSTVTLTSNGTASTFTPATSNLGYGNVNIALSLAEASLKQLGIINPTPAQLQAALMGGTVTTATGTTDLKGILQLRSEGKGWGVIANSMGFKLGDVVRSPNATAKSSENSQRSASSSRSGNADVAKPVRVEKSERVERADRPERIERPEKIERPDLPTKPDRPERAGR